VKAIKEAGRKKGDEVVEELLRVVTDVKPEVPERVTAPPEG
jgi:V-type H+-transporting ATPase subunit G